MIVHLLDHLSPVIAHRGASAQAPENTLIAMQMAKACGARWVEFDVRLSKDNRLVVIHDDALSRTTTGVGKVFDATLAQIKQYDAGAWFSSDYAGEHVPTLEEMIVCLGECGLCANIEIKCTPEQANEITQQVLRCVQAHWPENLPPPLFSSFTIEAISALRALSDEVLIGLLIGKWRSDWSRLAAIFACASVHVNDFELTEARVSEIAETKLKILAYTVDSIDRAQTLFSWGVDAVFTNYPDILLEYL